MMSAALIVTVCVLFVLYGFLKTHNVWRKEPRFKDSVSRRLKWFSGEYACVDRMEMETGEERRAYKQVFCSGK